MADLFERDGESGRAQSLRLEADDLRARFDRDFWTGDATGFALAVQGDGSPCQVISSNPGHALWSGIVDDDRAAAVDLLARQLVERFGAPTVGDARTAAEEEMSFAESLCSQPKDTLIAVHRTFEDGAVRESFRTLRARSGPTPARAFSFLEVDGEDEHPGEDVDLIAIADRERK